MEGKEARMKMSIYARQGWCMNHWCVTPSDLLIIIGLLESNDVVLQTSDNDSMLSHKVRSLRYSACDHVEMA